MKQTASRLRACVLSIAIAGALTLPGCIQPGFPGGGDPPAIEGSIYVVDRSIDGVTLLFIRAPAESTGMIADEAFVTVPDDVQIIDANTDEEVSDLVERGWKAAVWIVGPVSESAPVQVTAGRVLVAAPGQPLETP